MILKIRGSDLDIQYESAGQTFVTNRIGSTEKAEMEIGFTAQIELEEGLRNLIEWRKEAIKRSNK